MNKIKEKKIPFNFPLKINGKNITEKYFLYILKKNRILSEVTFLPGLHNTNSIEELKSDYIKNCFKKPELRFSKSMENFFKKNPRPKNIKTAYLLTVGTPHKGLEGTFKVKIGRSNKEKENKFLLDLTSNPNNKLRLDGNRTCSSLQVNEIIKGIRHEQIDYIEDSFINEEEEIKFHNQNPTLKIAMDEQIVSYFISKNWSKIPKHIGHVVLKLSLIGGADELHEVAKALSKRKITFNLSSTFESEIGIMFLSELSRRSNFPNITLPGLDTLKYFK